MKIKEHLSVYLESGYLFDDMSGKLKWFEIDKILISFTYGVVRYVGTWGGCRIVAYKDFAKQMVMAQYE